MNGTHPGNEPSYPQDSEAGLLTLSATIDVSRVNAWGQDKAFENSKNTASGGLMRDGARCRRERMPTAFESAIRPRFVPDSFHSLNTAANSQPNRRIVIQIQLKGPLLSNPETFRPPA